MLFKSQMLISMNTCEKASGTQPSNLPPAVTPIPRAPSQADPSQPGGLAQEGLVEQEQPGPKYPPGPAPLREPGVGGARQTQEGSRRSWALRQA